MPERREFMYCTTVRSEGGSCGLNGKLFEPKPAAEAKEGE